MQANGNSNLIQVIKDAMPIEQAASRYLPGLMLKRRGRYLWGCCPLHREKTPSFVIVPEKDQFKCFGCGEYGDSIDMVAKVLGIPLPDTVKLLAEDLGISMTVDTKKYREVQTRIDQEKRKANLLKSFADKVREDHRFLQRFYSLIKKDLKNKAKGIDDLDDPGVIGMIEMLGEIERLMDCLLSDEVAIQYRGLCGVEDIRECINQRVITS